MKIKTAAGDITKVKTGAILAPVYEDSKSPAGDAAIIDKALGGMIVKLIKQGEIKGKLNEFTLLHCTGKLAAERVAVVGLGKKKELTLEKVRSVTAEICRYLQKKNIQDIAAGAIGTESGIKTEPAAQAMAEGALLGLYTFKRHMTKKDDDNNELIELTIYGKEKAALDKGIATAKIIAEATNLVRDMVNEPANFMTPSDMAAEAKQMAKKYGLKVEVFEKEKIKEMGMGGLLGVAQGSAQPPRFIVLSYKGRSSQDIDVALVGKGLTFDSGGLDIKPGDYMEGMNGDMAGGASVMGTVAVIAQLKPKINVTAFVPATENMPSGTALKVNDVIKALNGKTIQVLNTDAEGRLILSDALSYAVKLGAKNIIDVATLTGSCRAALGVFITGIFSNNKALENKIVAAGESSGEQMWAFPMNDEFKEMIKSDIADVKNVGGKYAGAISAAKFLEEFVDKTPWVHLDIAGTSETDKDKGYQVKGATGTPVRMLVDFIMAEAAGKKR
jgi:leucyl aminopeptidase